MKWINLCYLILSIVLATFISYAIVDNMINYCMESASYYLDLLLKCMMYFLFYVLLNIVYLVILILRSYKKMYFDGEIY